MAYKQIYIIQLAGKFFFPFFFTNFTEWLCFDCNVESDENDDDDDDDDTLSSTVCILALSIFSLIYS
jgi:hypothetical protein